MSSYSYYKDKFGSKPYNIRPSAVESEVQYFRFMNRRIDADLGEEYTRYFKEALTPAVTNILFYWKR